MRATAVATADQAMLSALNFSLALALIRFATKDEYGLYSQLISLQSLFSPIHAGLFASAYLALAPRMSAPRSVAYRTGMARAEILLTLASSLFVAALTYAGARLFAAPLSWATVLASTAALLALWWREFVRQIHFAESALFKVLRVDFVYVLLTGAALAWAVATDELDARVALWCAAAGGLFAAAVPLLTSAFSHPVRRGRMRSSLRASWKLGRWDALGSTVSWASGQSYVYFAAAHGGLAAAAEVSAGRLLATPLLLVWASYANVLRPGATRALATRSSPALQPLLLRSAVLVVGCSLAYAVLLFLLLPIVSRVLFAGRFSDLAGTGLLWTGYAMFTGLTTVAASVLRSALQFRQVFNCQLLACTAALALLGMSLNFPGNHALVLALVLAEVLSVMLLWRQLAPLLHAQPTTHPGNLQP